MKNDIIEAVAKSFKKLDPISLKLKSLIKQYENGKYSFVKVTGKEAEPLAKNGDVLVVSQDKNLENTNWIMAKIGNNTLIKQYLLTDNDEISLKSSGDDNYKFSRADFKKEVKVLGIIKSKISIETL